MNSNNLRINPDKRDETINENVQDQVLSSGKTSTDSFESINSSPISLNASNSATVDFEDFDDGICSERYIFDIYNDENTTGFEPALDSLSSSNILSSHTGDELSSYILMTANSKVENINAIEDLELTKHDEHEIISIEKDVLISI